MMLKKKILYCVLVALVIVLACILALRTTERGREEKKVNVVHQVKETSMIISANSAANLSHKTWYSSEALVEYDKSEKIAQNVDFGPVERDISDTEENMAQERSENEKILKPAEKNREPWSRPEERVIDCVDLEPEVHDESKVEADAGLKPLGTYSIKGYDTCAYCCGKTDGITASGAVATVGRTCASNDFPLGTVLYIEGIGYRTVEDRGGMARGVIDVLCTDHPACYAITGEYAVYIAG